MTIEQIPNSDFSAYHKDKILLTTSDNNGNIKSIDFNTVEVNRILVGTSKIVEKNLKELEKKHKTRFLAGMAIGCPSQDTDRGHGSCDDWFGTGLDGWEGVWRRCVQHGGSHSLCPLCHDYADRR